MAIKISGELQKAVRNILSNGRYKNACHVLEEAVMLLEQRDKLRAELMTGIDQLDSGQRVAGQDVFAELRERVSEIESSEP